MLFSWQRRSTDPPPILARTNPLPHSERDWSAFENSKGWPSIKVWLTVDLAQCLDQLGEYRYQSRSEVMRDLLFLGLYGAFTYAQVLSERRGLLREPGRLVSGEGVHFCANDELPLEPPKPEKKRHNVRLFLPEPMKVAIETIAKQRRSSVSVTARTLIEQMLFGALGERNVAQQRSRTTF